MGDLRSDSAMCRRIVSAFLDFLKSVEPAPGVDLEGLDVAKDCLEEVFKLNQAAREIVPESGLLINLFSSLKDDKQYKPVPHLGSVEVPNSSFAASDSQQVKDCNGLSSNSGNESETQHLSGGDLRDELFVKFYAALDKINFFSTSGEIEDPLRVAKATQLFHDTIKEIENSEGEIMNLISLAETFKAKGNLSMKLKLYSDAVELYTFAIALHEKNAVYYCNRAAAYTQMEKYIEAIEDCLKSIEIDPTYSKAYSRLGLAYYNRGNYAEALEKGFLRAFQLDPNNESIKENIRAAQQKLVESSTFDTEQNTESRHRQDSNAKMGDSTSSSSSFASFPITFDSSAIPPELVNVVRNVVSAATQGNHAQTGNNVDLNEPEDSQPDNTRDHNEPNIRTDANVNLNFSQAPDQVRDALRSFLNSFSSQNATQRQP
ncbi:small glutamine-rich tetratricopeptide repeat-containing protein 2 isoform X2 [Phalaenopsis equestris]|uniref:small glutamine-rich tetratricopeptide repeat-containing protein 2 isoform X2 n=1 Tax=Phalaenopsis equestris TaxID=78828 RepID=UPI0009E3AD60|nr:small glutamine-rich tetratricopeptide repeat-containing protein 2 isoform X2 [Phalaenopsis equestris]